MASLRKRILGRRHSLVEIRRVAETIHPLVEAAAMQPEVQPTLEQMAETEGISAAEMRERWIALQDADLLLESGGDPDAVSPAKATGVAQWMAGTGRKAGLTVDLKSAANLTQQIFPLTRQVAWLEYLQRPDADPHAPGAPTLTGAQAAAQLPTITAQRNALRLKRSKADARYDARQAIFAQTRYLLGLYPRFPSPDWIFQAYHGGEGGVTRTLKYYCGTQWPGSAAFAIQKGAGGKPLSFETLSYSATPRSHTDAFGYLFSRGDDHRHYWWKLKAAEEALALYQRDPAECARQWAALLPGRPTEALWYTDAVSHPFRTPDDLRKACANHQLLPVTTDGEINVRPLPEDPKQAKNYAVLRPETLGALRLVAAAYRQCGGQLPLTLHDLALTTQIDQQRRAKKALSAAAHPPASPPLRALWPPDPDAATLPGGGPPADFDYHTLGAAFDIERPSSERNRKILEYALGYFEERGIVTSSERKDTSARCYHVVANPRYTRALTKIALSGKTPAFPGL